MRLRRAVAVATAVGLVSLAACGGDETARRPGIDSASASATADIEYVIPAGTAERIDAGEEVEIVPAELVVSVGDVLRIRNDDVRGHVVGAFYVAAGETLTQTFSSPGELSGECSVHPSGSFTLTVEE